tara:strand:- start:129 stop:383 length:255 start_codon:yes stop_codon:yes gene_type:complete
VFLNFIDVKIDHVIDQNILKQGKIIPKLNIPIKPLEDNAFSDDCEIVVLAWNFYDEIVSRVNKENCNIIKFFPQIQQTKGIYYE